MSSVVITLQSPHLQGAIDLELPDDVPMNQLLPKLVESLGLSPSHYRLARRSRILRDGETLQIAQILTGDILTLTSTQAPRSQAGAGHGVTHYMSSAILTTPSGRVIALDNLGKDELLIGRYDPRSQQVPDIDLGAEPQGNTVSRAHASLQRQGGQWNIKPQATRNPTRIGKQVVSPKELCPLKSGDVITLGDVQLTFS